MKKSWDQFLQALARGEEVDGRDFSIQAVTGQFSPASGTLSVFGDSLDNSIEVSRNAAGQLLINGGAVAIRGGTATVANTALIQVFGQAATTSSH